MNRWVLIVCSSALASCGSSRLFISRLFSLAPDVVGEVVVDVGIGVRIYSPTTDETKVDARAQTDIRPEKKSRTTAELAGIFFG